jgi:hypothetical protein
MAYLRIPLLLSTSLTLITTTTSFSPSPNLLHPTRQFHLHAVIEGDAIEEEALDEDAGFVGLTKRCAIKIKGTTKKGGEADCDFFKDLTRYEKMVSLSESEVQSATKKFSCNIVGNGMGKELYYFPDDSVRVEDKVIKLAPTEAAKDLLSKAGSVGDAKYIILNFLGGDDLILGEVMDAADFLVKELDVPEKAKITFNSVSYKDFEMGTCSVTVVAVGGQSGGEGGFEESLAKGEVYAYDGKWYTVSIDDITTATE